ncbi:hypothetical protein GW756_05685 [bacterium]|nr:hypothetical protein [bacterium]NCQ55911.1 hypothetical protein [Candidatus Parcubacteria bacterium]NCS67936.1 hypothetical protein [Candidatus Peregrinibacteria bacterium]NCS96830.1 hypothetical protein [bacterium]
MALNQLPSIPAIPRSPESAPSTFIIPGGTSDLVKTLILPELDKLVRLGRCSNTRFLFINREGKGETDEQRNYLDAELKTQHGYNDKETRQLMQKVFAAECRDLTDEEALRNLFNPHHMETLVHNVGETRWLMHTALGPEIWGKMITRMPELPNMEKILLEKPVGTNQEEAKGLIGQIKETPYADKTRAIDHYLGKTLIDYIVKLKQGRNTDSEISKGWANVFETLLDPQYWESVKVIMDEEKNVNGRGSFFESVGGIVPDMLQSHMLLTLASIEAVVGEPEKSDEQIKAFLNGIQEQQILALAQYRGYRDHEKVDNQSQTPTGIKGKFSWNNGSSKIPHHFRVAKGVNQKRGRIEIVFRDPIYSEADQSYIDSIHIRLHRRTVILLKRGPNGENLKEEITLVPDSVADLGAYGNVYSGAIAGENTATVSLDNVLASHQAAAPFLDQQGVTIDRHPQGEVWGNF